jgi:hypothetical protein
MLGKPHAFRWSYPMIGKIPDQAAASDEPVRYPEGHGEGVGDTVDQVAENLASRARVVSL